MVIGEIGGAALPQEAVPGTPGAGDGSGAADAEVDSGGPAGVPACCWPQPEASTTAPRATATRAGTLRIADSFRSVIFTCSGLRRDTAGGGSRDRPSPANQRSPFPSRRNGAASPINVGLIRVYPHLSLNAQLRILTPYYWLVML